MRRCLTMRVSDIQSAVQEDELLDKGQAAFRARSKRGQLTGKAIHVDQVDTAFCAQAITHMCAPLVTHTAPSLVVHQLADGDVHQTGAYL